MYKARDIALKVLAGAMGVERRKRFEQEAGLISQLNHPHVRAVHDIGEHEGGLYIALKFLEGEPLGQRLVRGPLPVSETLRFGAQIADALAQAHRKSVTQCDLKPANIILVRSGGVVSAKLLDFGRASASADRAIGAGAVGRSGGLTHRHFFVRAGGAGDGDGRSGVSRGDARGADRPVRRRCGHCAQDLATQLNGLSEPVSAPSGALAAGRRRAVALAVLGLAC